MRLVNANLIQASGRNLLLVAGVRMFFLIAFLSLLPGCQKEMKPSEQGSDLGQRQRPLTMTKNLKSVDLQLVAANLVSPLGVEEAPDGTGRLFVFDQTGTIWILQANGTLLSTPFLDLSSKLVPLRPFYDERGLIGFTFHPDFKNNGLFYVHYQAPPRPGGPTVQTGNTGLPMTWNNLSRLSEFRVSANPNVANLGSERVLLEWDDPQSNHNGGTVAFGPDGYLYISIGDGGNKNDIGPGHVHDWYAVNAGGNGQDIEQNLLGSILRLDVNSSGAGKNYAIPADNPFVGKAGLDEIYAYGFRNPYRFSFDLRGSRRLFAGDAGQVLYEEISVVEKGGNYGWNVKEATHCFNAANEFSELPSCPSVDVYGNRLINPVIELNNWQNPKGGRATTIIGGNVYRGHEIPGFQGKYIFGTFSQTPTTPNGELFIANPAGPGLWAYQELELESHPSDIGYYLKGFGQDLEGELYVTVSSILGPSGNTGKVFKLVQVGKK